MVSAEEGGKRRKKEKLPSSVFQLTQITISVNFVLVLFFHSSSSSTATIEEVKEEEEAKEKKHDKKGYKW